MLEDRSVPTANASGTLTGIAFIDHNGNGVFDQGEFALTGLTVTLTGTTTAQNTPVSTTAVTDGNGAFTFLNVLPGTYEISATNAALLSGGPNPPSHVSFVSGLSVSGGQTVNQDLAFEGLDPHYVRLGLLSSSITPADYPCDAPAGGGSGLANYRPDNAPVVANAIGAANSLSVAENSSPTQIDLAGVFSDPDITNSEVTFNTSVGPINVTLFDTTAPQTVANFFDYVNAGDYNNTFFNRFFSGQFLQGGGATLQTDPTTGAVTGLTQTPTNPGSIPNESSAASAAPNTQYTLAMGLSNAPNGTPLPNSATDQFFFNLGDNSASYDGTYTVFGQVADTASQAVLNELSQSATPTNESGTSVATQLPAVDLSDLPLVNYTPTTGFPTDATASNFLTINSITIDNQDERLTYSVVANSNPGLVTPSLTDEHLALNYASGQTGSATITVQAADRYGATVDDTFTVNVLPLTITSVPALVNAANQTSTTVSGTTVPGGTVFVTATDGINTTSPAVSVTADDVTGNWTATGATGINVSSLSDGTITYTATTTIAGNTGSTSMTTTKAADAAQVGFTTPAQTSLTAGIVSGPITVQVEDASGNAVAESGDVINLGTTSGGGAFYSDAAGTEVITSINTLADGSATFYYKDTTAGTPTLTAIDTTNTALTAGTQQETIS